jgi:hypothetical protein
MQDPESMSVGRRNQARSWPTLTWRVAQMLGVPFPNDEFMTPERPKDDEVEPAWLDSLGIHDRKSGRSPR